MTPAIEVLLSCSGEKRQHVRAPRRGRFSLFHFVFMMEIAARAVTMIASPSLETDADPVALLSVTTARPPFLVTFGSGTLVRDKAGLASAVGVNNQTCLIVIVSSCDLRSAAVRTLYAPISARDASGRSATGTALVRTRRGGHLKYRNLAGFERVGRIMNNSLSPLSVLVSLAFGLLAGCHSDAPVAANSTAAMRNVSGSLSSRTVVVPDNFVANEDAREAEPLKPSEGMSWRWDAARATASFGPSTTATVFSIECSIARNQLIFHRYLPARGSSTGTMSFTGNGHVASLSAATTGGGGSQAGSWQAIAASSDLSATVAKVFVGTAPVAIAVAGSREFVTSPSPITQQPFAACRP